MRLLSFECYVSSPDVDAEISDICENLPILAIIDTGAERSLISKSLAKSLKLISMGKSDFASVNG